MNTEPVWYEFRDAVNERDVKKAGDLLSANR
jgi:hypothetical protein